MKPDQNNRLRSRPTGPRRDTNPLTRSYESNGPDVKIRGTARHIADKYLQLARDAHTGGNSVAAENYLQHAEHYYRLIAAAAPRAIGEPHQDEEAEYDDEGMPDRFALPAETAPQPFAAQSGTYPRKVG